MFSFKNYDIPIDVIAYVILKHISYFQLDKILKYFRLTPKEMALVKFKIYKQRIQITTSGRSIEYKIDGRLHRINGPAMEVVGNVKIWYISDTKHRTDGPAAEWTDGTQEWYMHGKRHRLDGPAVISSNGNVEWWLRGKLHREDGPAVEFANGTKCWYINDKLHREDGPAIIYASGKKEFWMNGKKMPHYNKPTRKKII